MEKSSFNPSALLKDIEARILLALPDARVDVHAFRGEDHFEASVVSSAFAGKTLVEQHRMVYAAMEGLLGGPVHALSLKTRTPKEAPS